MRQIVLLILAPTLISSFSVSSKQNTLTCKSSNIQCVDETSFTICINSHEAVILGSIVLKCPDGSVCNDENKNYPCVPKSSVGDSLTSTSGLPPTISDDVETANPSTPGTTDVDPTTTEPTTTELCTSTSVHDAETTAEPTTSTETTEPVTWIETTTTTEPTTTTEIDTTTQPTTTVTTETPLEEDTIEAITTSTPSTSTTRTVVERPTGPPNCQAEGVWPAPACNQYYKCVKKSFLWITSYNAELNTCSGTEVFSSTLLECVDPQYSDCP